MLNYFQNIRKNKNENKLNIPNILKFVMQFDVISSKNENFSLDSKFTIKIN